MTFTYFISNGTFVKIGRSTNPYWRLKGLQGHFPYKLRMQTFIFHDFEKDFHNRFRDYRRNGEWFVFSPYISTFIKQQHSAFHIWLLRQVDGHDIVSEFARVIQADENFPRYLCMKEDVELYLRKKQSKALSFEQNNALKWTYKDWEKALARYRSENRRR